jgi:hypothetical protein
LDIKYPLDNLGVAATVRAANGVIQLWDGGLSTGAYEATNNGVVHFWKGTYVFKNFAHFGPGTGTIKAYGRFNNTVVLEFRAQFVNNANFEMGRHSRLHDGGTGLTSGQFLNQAKFTWLAGRILSLRVTNGLDHPTAVFEITKNAEGPNRLLDSSLLTNYGIVNWRDADFTMASTVGYCGIRNLGTFIAWSDAPLYTIPINGVIEFINDVDAEDQLTGVFVKMPGSDPSDIFVDFINNGDVYGSYLLSFWGSVSGNGNWW